jgi:hypothetical protein
MRDGDVAGMDGEGPATTIRLMAPVVAVSRSGGAGPTELGQSRSPHALHKRRREQDGWKEGREELRCAMGWGAVAK